MSMIFVPPETKTNLRHYEYSNFDEHARHNYVCESYLHRLEDVVNILSLTIYILIVKYRIN